MDQESDLQPADEGLPQRDLEHASDFDTEVVREEKEELKSLFALCMELEREEVRLWRERKEALERERKEALERERKEALERAFMEVLWIELKEAPEREEFRNLNCMSDELEKALARMRKEALERKLKKAPESGALWYLNDMDFLGIRKIERIGGAIVDSHFLDEYIINMSRRGLRALLKDKSLYDIVRNKIKGELAVRSIAKFKGKAAANSSYDTGESSNNTSSLNSPIRTEIPQRSELDHVSIPLAPLKFSMMADRSKCDGASASASRRSLNDHTEGTTVTKGRGSPESTVQGYPLPRPPLPASRNEQVDMHDATAKCRDNHNVGGAGTTVFSSEPTAHYQHSAAYAPAGADIEAGPFTTCSEPPPETIAIFKEPPAVILIAGAFSLLSGNPETFRGPVERVLLGVMTVGFICSFMWPLMGGRRRMAGVSSLLQWTAVWAMFVAFFLIMTLLITH